MDDVTGRNRESLDVAESLDSVEDFRSVWMIGAMVAVLLPVCLERGAIVRPMVRRAVIVQVPMDLSTGMDVVEDLEKKETQKNKKEASLFFKMSACE